MPIHDTLLLLLNIISEDCNRKLHKLKLQFEVNSENRATIEAGSQLYLELHQYTVCLC